MLEDACRITGNNFSLIWRVLLYKSAVFLLVFGLFMGSVYPIMSPVFSEITKTTFLEDVRDVAAHLFSGNYFLDGFKIPLEKLNVSLLLVKDIVGAHMVNMVFAYIAAGLVLLIAVFLLRLPNYALASAVNDNMSADAKNAFFPTMIKNLGSAVKFNLAYVLFTVPCDLIIAAAAFVALYYLLPAAGVLTVTFVVAVTVLLCAFRMSLFGFWLPEYIERGDGIFKSLRSGARTAFKEFRRFYSLNLVVVLIVMSVNIFFFMYTFGAGLFIVLPASNLFLVSYFYVNYYRRTNKSYYLTHDAISRPPQDLSAELGNGTLPEEEVQKRAEELRKKREKIENQKKSTE